MPADIPEPIEDPGFVVHDADEVRAAVSAVARLVGPARDKGAEYWSVGAGAAAGAGGGGQKRRRRKGTDSVPEKYSRSFPGICPPAHALLPAPAPQKQAGGIGRIRNRTRRSRGAHDEDADLNATEFLRCNSRRRGTSREGRVSGRGREGLAHFMSGGRTPRIGRLSLRERAMLDV